LIIKFLRSKKTNTTLRPIDTFTFIILHFAFPFPFLFIKKTDEIPRCTSNDTCIVLHGLSTRRPWQYHQFLDE